MWKLKMKHQTKPYSVHNHYRLLCINNFYYYYFIQLPLLLSQSNIISDSNALCECIYVILYIQPGAFMATILIVLGVFYNHIAERRLSDKVVSL